MKQHNAPTLADHSSPSRRLFRAAPAIVIASAFLLASFGAVLIMLIELLLSASSSSKSDFSDTVNQTFLIGKARVFQVTTHDGVRLVKFSTINQTRPAFTSINYDFDPDSKVNEIEISLDDKRNSVQVGLHAAMSSDLFLAVLNEFQGRSFRIVLGQPKGVLVQWFLVSKKWSVKDFGGSWSREPGFLISGNLVFFSVAGTCWMVVISQAVVAFFGFAVCLFPLTWIASSACQRYFLRRARSDALPKNLIQSE